LIVRVLLDTTILLRLVDDSSEKHQECLHCLEVLNDHAMPVTLFHNLAEFWAVASRPKPPKSKGLGWTFQQTSAGLKKIKLWVPILDLPKDPRRTWEDLVRKHHVMGFQVHDTKMVAAMMENNIETIVTYNIKDFKRFKSIRARRPQDVVREILGD